MMIAHQEVLLGELVLTAIHDNTGYRWHSNVTELYKTALACSSPG